MKMNKPEPLAFSQYPIAFVDFERELDFDVKTVKSLNHTQI